jgi:hypothetical protein
MAGFAIIVCTSTLVQFVSLKLGSARSSVLLLSQVSFTPPLSTKYPHWLPDFAAEAGNQNYAVHTKVPRKREN